MNNRGLIIALIILLSVIIFALVMFLVLSLNGRLNIGSIGFGTKRSETIIFDEVYNLEDIDYIEIISVAGNVTFKESTDNMIKVVAYGKDIGDVDVKLDSGKLKVDYSKLSKNFVFFNTYSNDINVYIPSSYSEKIKISNDYGNCEISDLENATIDVEANCGNVELGKVKNAKLKCDLGNVKVENLLNKCDIEVDCGDVKIENAQIKENSKIKCDLGNVKIKEINDIYIDAQVDLGNTKVGKNNRQSEITLKVEVDCGDLKISE